MTVWGFMLEGTGNKVAGAEMALGRDEKMYLKAGRDWDEMRWS